MSRRTKKMILATPDLPGPEDVEYSLENEPERDILDGGVFLSFRQEFRDDPQTVQWIASQLANGNDWAWCMVDVAAKWTNPLTGQEYEGHTYLGGCSYESEESFKHPDGYYPQMKREAYDDLIKQIERDLT